MGGGIDGPADHLKVALVGFLEEVGGHEISTDGELPRADFNSFFEGILNFSVVQQAGHQRGLEFTEASENDRIERDHHDARNFAGVAQIADERVFTTPEAARLEFQIEDHIVLAGKFENLDESGDAFADEFASEPGAGIEAADFGEGELVDGAVPAGGAVDGIVVDGHKVRITGEVKIGFDEGNTLGDSPAKRRQGIFRGVSRGAAMRDGQHVNSVFREVRATVKQERGIPRWYANTDGKWKAVFRQPSVQESKHEGARRRVFVTLRRMHPTLRRKLAIFMAIFLTALLCVAAETRGQGPSKKAADKAAAKSEEHSLAHDVRHQLQVLPYYSVFDYITFNLDGGKVTLSGEVVRPTLRTDAEAAVRSIEGVASVTNLIEVLPKSAADDELRRGVYRAIYEDFVLQRYAVSSLPAIHILVKEGGVTLEGAVASEGEKNLVGTRAKGVSGVIAVKNSLAVRAKDAAAN